MLVAIYICLSVCVCLWLVGSLHGDMSMKKCDEKKEEVRYPLIQNDNPVSIR